jgi:hypothetical protein
MDPLIGGAISFGASALSSLFNNRSQRKTNQMNYKIMQEQNQFNAQEAAKNRDWQEQMYQKYSSVGSQVAQMRANGLNPFLSGVSPAEFSGSGSAASAAESAQIQPLDYGGFASGAANAVSTYQQQESINSTVDLQKTQEALNKTLSSLQEHQGSYWQNQAKLLKETLTFKVNQAKFQAQKSEWDSISSQYYSTSMQYDALTKAFQYGFGMPKLQCEMYMKQLDNVAFQLITMRENAKLTHAEFLYKMREYGNFYSAFGLQKFRAQTDRIAANAQSLNARTAAELMPHTAGMLDNQSSYYKGMSQNEGQKLYMSRKWDSKFKALTYTAIKSRIDLQDSMGGYYESGKWRNYVGIGTDIVNSATGVFSVAKGIPNFKGNSGSNSGALDRVTETESTIENYDANGTFKGARTTKSRRTSSRRKRK